MRKTVDGLAPRGKRFGRIFISRWNGFAYSPEKRWPTILTFGDMPISVKCNGQRFLPVQDRF